MNGIAAQTTGVTHVGDLLGSGDALQYIFDVADQNGGPQVVTVQPDQRLHRTQKSDSALDAHPCW